MPKTVSKKDLGDMISILKSRELIKAADKVIGPKGGRPSPGYALIVD